MYCLEKFRCLVFRFSFSILSRGSDAKNSESRFGLVLKWLGGS